MKIRLFIFSIWLVTFMTPMLYAEEMVYIYHKPESKEDVRYNYQWELLKAVLERTKDKYGPYVMKPSDMVMNEKRQLAALKEGEKLTIMINPANTEYENILTPVRIPLDKGLIGYRVFLINKNDQPKFTAIKTLDELKKLSVG